MPSKTYHVVAVFDAPLNYVYRWCTDYREDDYLITGSAARRHFVERNRKTVAWITHTHRNGTDTENLRIVTLKPPKRWSVMGLGEDLNEEGDYVLKQLGPRKTELRMIFRIYYKSAKPEPASTWEKRIGGNWEKFKAALEKDYNDSLQARRGSRAGK